ncbi:MAG: MATE family efflux transporter [Roseburia sp.]|nr:MATE family efflux transporter [Roseburia sp.]
MKNHTLFRDYTKYASLNVLGMLGLSCYILADTFFISNGLGTNGLTALNLAIPIYSFIHGSGLMLGMGGATKYAIAKSQEKPHAANRIFTNTIILGAAFALFFMLLGIFFSQTITTLLGANEQVFEMTNTYLKVILLFAPAFLMNDIFICFVRNDGAPGLSMTAMVTGSLSNILLDYILIFPCGMGILGAVLATGLTPIISMSILAKHGLQKQNEFHFIKIKPSLPLSLESISLGFPSLITEVSSGVVMIVFNQIILGLQGNVGVAAYGVIANLSLVVIAIYTGIAQGVQPLISLAHGSGSNSDIRSLLRYAMITMILVSATIYAPIYLFAEPITIIFNSENNWLLQEIATRGLRLYFTAIPFAGFNIIIPVFFTSTERPLPAHVLSLLRGLILIIPLAFLLANLLGIVGVWLAFPAAEAIVALLGIVLYWGMARNI